MDYSRLTESLKKVAMDADWHEEQHHRADNGRFTSGSGRGKTKEDEDDAGKDKTKENKDGKKPEMSFSQANGIIREAFRVTGGGLKELKLVGHKIETTTDIKNEIFANKKKAALNSVLKKHGLKAEFKGRDYNTYTIAEDAAIDYSNDPFFNILSGLCAIEMLSKDLHYRAKGKPFYGLHELADIIWGIGRASDEINEVYYMGEKQMDPPSRSDVAEAAVGGLGAFGNDSDHYDEDALIKALTEKCVAVTASVEEAKKLNPSSGTAAVLDDISKRCLQATGLLRRTAKSVANSGAIDNVVQKGIVLENGETPAQDTLTVKKDAVGRPCLATAQDKGTHEGAVKAAQTRKMHGGYAKALGSMKADEKRTGVRGIGEILDEGRMSKDQAKKMLKPLTEETIAHEIKLANDFADMFGGKHVTREEAIQSINNWNSKVNKIIDNAPDKPEHKYVYYP